jgi:hypothetical protein
MRHRIESHTRSINDTARALGHCDVNGVRFTPREDAGGRVISDEVTEDQIGSFTGVDGYARVTSEPPYAILQAFGAEPPLVLSTGNDPRAATSEGDPDAPAPRTIGLGASLSGRSGDTPPEPEPEPEVSDDDGGDAALSDANEGSDGLDELSKAALIERLRDRGMDVGNRATKADIIALLRRG